MIFTCEFYEDRLNSVTPDEALYQFYKSCSY